MPIQHSLILALFGHKITLYRFKQGLILLQGAQIGAGAEPSWPTHFNHPNLLTLLTHDHDPLSALYRTKHKLTCGEQRVF